MFYVRVLPQGTQQPNNMTITATPAPRHFFSRWSATPATTFANRYALSTTMPIPLDHTVVTANWLSPHTAGYAAGRVPVIVRGTDATNRGEGWHVPGSTITIQAGALPGRAFTHWQYDGIEIAEPLNSTTTIVVPNTPNVPVILHAISRPLAPNEIPHATNMSLLVQHHLVGESPLTLQAYLTPANATADPANARFRVIPGGSLHEDYFTLVGSSISAMREGTVRVRAYLPGGGTHGVEMVRDFTITFSTVRVHAYAMGLEALHVGVDVNAYIVFDLLTGEWENTINPADFSVSGLPRGLISGTARRHSNTQVVLPITGAPTLAEEEATIRVIGGIAARNIIGTNWDAGVLPPTLELSPVMESARLNVGSILFDLNPLGALHRAVSIQMQPNEIHFVDVFYGNVLLLEGIEFFRDGYVFTLPVSFLSQLPAGQWQLTFIMTQGNNPELTLSIMDTRNLPLRDDDFPDPGEPPVPPPPPPPPTDRFAVLTCGTRVNMDTLAWGAGIAALHPPIHGDRAVVYINADVLEHLAYTRSGESFCIITPIVQLCVPTDILAINIGARDTVINRGIWFSAVALRISLIDRSAVAALRNGFAAAYPGGQILSPLVELRMEIVDMRDGTVVLTTREFSRPLDMTFTAMGAQAFMRPAGLFIENNTPVYVPHISPAPGQVVTRSRFPGVHGAMHSAAFFTDVPAHHFGFDAAHRAVSGGLVPAQDLHPYAQISRGEFVVMLTGALQLPRSGIPASGFADVPPGTPFFDAVRRANAAGLLDIWEGGNFHANAVVTRQEAAAIAGRAAMNLQPTRQPQPRSLGAAFHDSHLITTYHFPLLQFALNYGIVIGYPDGYFRPANPAGRMYAITIIINLARALGLSD
jgi:hypothetical protein